jgi:hypothetical protein
VPLGKSAPRLLSATTFETLASRTAATIASPIRFCSARKSGEAGL